MEALLRKLEQKIKGIARGLGNAGMVDTDDNEQNIQIGIMNAYAKQPTATESFLLEAGRNYARDILKSERKRQNRFVNPAYEPTDSNDEPIDIFDQIPHPNRNGIESEVKEFIEELKNVLTYKQMAILDFVYDGKSLPQVAKLLDWKIRTIQRDFVVIREEAQDIGHHLIDGYEAPQGTSFKHEPSVYGRAIQLLLF